MNKQKALTATLALILVASITANLFFLNQNLTLHSQTAAAKTKIDMTTTLAQAQTSIDAELQRIGESIVYASQQLSTTGLSGPQADNILSTLVANSSFIINAATENTDNIMVAAQPDNYSFIIGNDVGDQKWLNPNPFGEITPVMTPLIPLQSDMMGIALAAPIFNVDKELIGVVSVIFDPQTLINTSISTANAGKSYEFVCMQTDGLIIFDSDRAQQWKNLFTDEAYASYTSLLTLGQSMAAASSGYGTYTYNLNGSKVLAEKECYWVTVGAYGSEWRLIIVNALSS